MKRPILCLLLFCAFSVPASAFWPFSSEDDGGVPYTTDKRDSQLRAVEVIVRNVWGTKTNRSDDKERVRFVFDNYNKPEIHVKVNLDIYDTENEFFDAFARNTSTIMYEVFHDEQFNALKKMLISGEVRLPDRGRHGRYDPNVVAWLEITREQASFLSKEMTMNKIKQLPLQKDQLRLQSNENYYRGYDWFQDMLSGMKRFNN